MIFFGPTDGHKIIFPYSQNVIFRRISMPFSELYKGRSLSSGICYKTFGNNYIIHILMNYQDLLGQAAPFALE